MKTSRIVYWVSTVLFCGLFLTSGTSYLLHAPFFVKRITDLDYPVYLLNIIGTAKILGAVTLLTPKFKRLKEWAYAGFVFDLVGALWSHWVVQGFGVQVQALIPLTLVIISYISYRRLDRNGQLAIIKS